MLNVKGLWYLDLVKNAKTKLNLRIITDCEPPKLNSDWKLCWPEQQVKPWSSKNELTSQECRSPGRLKWLWTNHFQIFKGDHSLRDGFTRRNCCSWILSKFPPPPPPPANLDKLYSFFSDDKIQDLKVSLELKIPSKLEVAPHALKMLTGLDGWYPLDCNDFYSWHGRTFDKFHLWMTYIIVTHLIFIDASPLHQLHHLLIVGSLFLLSWRLDIELV